MYYAAYKDVDGQEKAMLFDNMQSFYNVTFSPDIEVICFIDFKVSGKTYQDRKKYVRDIAIDFSLHNYPGLFASDCWWIGDWFHIQGKRYGLLAEFIENGLCS